MPKQYGKFLVIAFYSRNSECPWMANTFRDLPVQINGRVWPTTEHFYQASKFPGNDESSIRYQQLILFYDKTFSKFPQFARECIEEMGLPFDSAKWDEDSKIVMRVAVAAKVAQHPHIREALEAMNTNTIIVEATERDRRWGDGNDGLGENRLGKIWMEQVAIAHDMTQDEATAHVEKLYKTFNDYRQATFPGRSLYEPSVESICQEIDAKIEALQINKKSDDKINGLVELKAIFEQNHQLGEEAMLKLIRPIKARYPKVTKGFFHHETRDLFNKVVGYCCRNDELKMQNIIKEKSMP